MRLTGAISLTRQHQYNETHETHGSDLTCAFKNCYNKIKDSKVPFQASHLYSLRYAMNCIPHEQNAGGMYGTAKAAVHRHQSTKPCTPHLNVVDEKKICKCSTTEKVSTSPTILSLNSAFSSR
jgi:hypothetical protein